MRVLPVAASVVLTSALCLGSSRAQVNQHQDQGTIRYQIARHLLHSGFSRYFPLNNGYRDARSMARNIEFKQDSVKARLKHGASLSQISWRIKDGSESGVPKLGGTAHIWSYAQGARPAYYPTSDVGDVQITRGTIASKSWSTSSGAIQLQRKSGESKASFARRCVSTYLAANGFDTLAGSRQADLSSVKVRTRGQTVNWKAGKMVHGDGRSSYALGGQIRLTQSGATISVNRAMVNGWRVAAVRNGAGRRTHFPSGHAMPRYRAYGRAGK